MHCLLAAYIAKYPRSSCHQLRLATCRGMNTVKPIKFATFRLERHWQFSGDVGVGFRAYMWENKCACYGKTVEDFHRCSRAAAGPLPGSFRIAGSSPANKQSCTRLQSFLGRGIYEQLRALDFSPNSARSVSFSTSSFSHWSPASGEIRTLIFVKAL